LKIGEIKMQESKNKKSNVIRIKSKTDPRAAAGSLTLALKEHGYAWMHAIGAGPVNQAVKAYIITKGHLAPLGFELVLDPSFDTVNIDGKEKTKIKFKIEPR